MITVKNSLKQYNLSVLYFLTNKIIDNAKDKKTVI